MGIAVRAEHLSKEYRLGAINHGMLYKDIQSWIARKTGKGDPHAQIGADHFADQKDRFWALKDLNFEIEQGDRVGIVGKNGAGKSTLLKILSRITAPTEGTVKIKGRIVSLLEVGTGFHPELTGRENIYLNGAILGMKNRAVSQKLDEIIAFSEIQQFIDTPVKRYSSGMYVRLAFAVAAHLDSDILLADEVLAVGDAAFQKKCIGKMENVSKNEGRTVLFVSHNMGAVKQLCQSGIMLTKGVISGIYDDSSTLIRDYLLSGHQSTNVARWRGDGSLGSAHFRPSEVYLGNEGGELVEMPIGNNSDTWLYIRFSSQELDSALEIAYYLNSADGDFVYYSQDTDTEIARWPTVRIGDNLFRTKLPKRLLSEGEYTIRIVVSLYQRAWIFEPNTTPISLYLSIKGDMSDSPYWTTRRATVVSPVLPWESLDPAKGAIT
ncbi:MAG TPA: ABC transporter ATP-binding protein [Rectinemataceae bacterium]|nr:ABC transporter ATP-binding protein [Rectinemataceae bacterium]